MDVDRLYTTPSDRDLPPRGGTAGSLREYASRAADPNSRCCRYNTSDKLAAIRHLHLSWVRGAYHRDV